MVAMGRQPVFARKAGESPPEKKGIALERKVGPAADAGLSASAESPGAVTCPACKCEFDPATDEILNAGEYEPGEGKQPTGADLEVPPVVPNPQAPIGTEAITHALAALGVQ
jgi:hypothetical protein